MDRELYLFDGKKQVTIDVELYSYYEKYVHPITDTTLAYLTHVLDLTEEMSAEELSRQLSEAMCEGVYMATVMKDDLIAAMRKMLQEDLEEIKVVTDDRATPQNITELLDCIRKENEED